MNRCRCALTARVVKYVCFRTLFKMLSAVRIASSTRPPVMLRVCSITFFLNLTCCDETNDHCSHIIVMFVTISAVLVLINFCKLYNN